jgi:hypothetical protein
MDNDKIAEDFLKSRNRYKDYDTRMLTAYQNGMIDILDAIAEAHPNLVFDMFKVREAVEEAIDAQEA